MQNINSNFIENILEQEGKIDLLEAFKVMVGCNHGILFNSQSKNVKYNNPDHQYYEYRQTLIDKKDEVMALAEKLGINATPLYDSFFHPWKTYTFDENIVKLTCKELGITYRELGDAIGYSGDTLNNAARAEKVSVPLQKAIELYKKTLEQEKELQKLTTLRSTLKSILE